MYNAKVVTIGIIILLLVFSSPFWASWIGMDYKSSGVVLPQGELSCIESTEFMRANHMRLLDEWRDQALRKEDRCYVSDLDGKRWEISLQNTCMKCHANYESFCQRCHVANSVHPYCWTCHVTPAGGK